MGFKRILLAGDGSQHSVRATEKAINIAKHTEGAIITLIHVIEDVPTHSDVMNDEVMIYEIPDYRKQRVTPLQDMLEKENILVIVKHKLADPARTIVREANEGKYDIVVIGSRGLNGFQLMMLGSISHKVIKQANCPVMLVK